MGRELAKRIMSFGLAGAVALSATIALSGAQASAAKKGAKVKLQQIGSPVWRPSDFHMFKHQVAMDYSDFLTIAGTLLPPPNHTQVPGLGIGPGTAHAGPYSSEFDANLANLSIEDQTTFSVSDFTLPSAVWMIWMNAPNEKGDVPTGVSPDGNATPIIPNSLFPMVLRGNLTKDGEMFDPYFRLEIPALDQNVDARFNGMDGHSHFPMFLAEDQSYGPSGQPRAGKYVLHMVELDVEGNGWSMDWSFTVK